MQTEQLLAQDPTPQTTAPHAAVATTLPEIDAIRQLVNQVKLAQKATLIGMVLIGFQLRALRAQHFPSLGGRPRSKGNTTGHPTFTALCQVEFGISRDSSTRWIAMADAVQQKLPVAEDLQNTFNTAPWDWSLSDIRQIETAIEAVTTGHSQREILAWHAAALIDLNLAGTPTITPTSNNLAGKNGTGSPDPILTEEQAAALRIEFARTSFFGHSIPGKCTPASPAHMLIKLTEPSSPIQHLPRPERTYIVEQILTPLIQFLKSLP